MSFIDTYFIDPIRTGNGYNAVNTLVYALIFVVLVFATYMMLKKLKIPIDKRFFLGISPFIALGGILRALEDFWESTNAISINSFLSPFIISASGTVKNVLLVTPLIYITIFFIALATLLIAKIVEKRAKKEYHKIWFGIGIILCVIALTNVRIINTTAFLLMTGIFVNISIALLFFRLFIRKKETLSRIFTKENTLLILAHMFDATTTFVSIQFFPYVEQHVVAGFFISLIGPVSIYFLKFPIVTAVLYSLDMEMKDDHSKRNFIKIAILILGLGPGLRNFLRLVMGV